VILTGREASSAIHVDFESLGTNIDRPALLGMLVADAAGDRFQQFVLDDALRGAIVVRKRVCVNATPDEAVTTIVDEAERHSRLVVSWSTLERLEVARVREARASEADAYQMAAYAAGY
jgi:hypothetical protein